MVRDLIDELYYSLPPCDETPLRQWRSKSEACEGMPYYACSCLLYAMGELGYLNERLVEEGERIVGRYCRVV